MPAGDQLERVRLLREQGHTPKQIARTLGIHSAEAAKLVRAAAALAQADAREPTLVGCWISPTWSAGLTITGHPDWPRTDESTSGIDFLTAVL